MIHFDEVKEKAIATVQACGEKTKQIYMIRDVYGKITVYVLSGDESDVADIRVKLRETIGSAWLGTVNCISENNLMFKEIKASTQFVSEGIFYGERPLVKKSWKEPKRNKTKRKTKIVTFYSYKGGVGRTTTLALVALQLARSGKKVVAIDFDLEAPGLSTVLRCDDKTPAYGLIDYLIESERNRDEIDLSEYMYPISSKGLLGLKGGEAYVLQAANLTSDNYDEYYNKLSRIDFNIPKYAQKNGIIDHLFDDIQQMYNPDIILIDARAGIHDIGGLALLNYSDEVVSLFYGNEQNMLGMRFTLPKLVKEEIPFYIVNTPVPVNEEEQKEELDLLLNTSLETLEKLDYFDDVPDLYDESSPHYPILIPYDNNLTNLNSNKRLNNMLESYGEDNIYKNIADKLLSNDAAIEEESVAFYKDIKPLLATIEKITPEKTGAAETEFETFEELYKGFYPLQEYKYIFDNNKFLITGAKGSGKTALFKVLKCADYIKNLALYLDVPSKEIGKTEWIVGLDQADGFPVTTHFNGIAKLNEPEKFAIYWKILLIKVLKNNIEDVDIIVEDKIRELFEMKYSDIPKWIDKYEDADQFLYDFIVQFDIELKKNQINVIVIYDSLDSLLDSSYRGRMLSQLVRFWSENISRLKCLHAKIFLRQDIFKNEVIELTDKIKLNNYLTTIEWNYDYLLSMIWKRMMENNTNLEHVITEVLKQEGYMVPKDVHVGLVPRPQKEVNRIILKCIVGEKMGKGNKAYTYNWILYRLRDTKEQIVPRSMLKLFSTAAKIELVQEWNTVRTRLIAPKSFEASMQEVSEDRITDMAEEYPNYRRFFSNLKNYCPSFPVEDETFMQGLLKCGLNEENIRNEIKELKDIGILKEYQRKKSDPIRYHIPDIYLKGMGLIRKGS